MTARKQAWIAGLFALILVVPAAQADDPDWSTMPYTLHAAYQAVDSTGFGTFLPSPPIRMRGILLNKASDMLDGTPSAPALLGGQWQVAVQAVDLLGTPDDDDDFGGTVLFMGQKYGNLPFIGDPAKSYSDEAWIAELSRLDHDPVSGRRFKPGDLVEVRARGPGLFYGGKTNINEKHNNALANDFDVFLLEPNHGLPTPAVITLADLKNPDDTFVFDDTRLIGCEHYQAAVVRINGVQFVDATNWGPNATLTITDGAGRTLPVLLGLGSGFSQYPAPTGTFDVVGVFDQEDGVSGDGWKDGYRLWAMDYDGTSFRIARMAAGDVDLDGDVDLADFGVFLACFNGPQPMPVDPNCDDVDFDNDDDVDLADFGVFLTCFNGPQRPVPAACPNLGG